MTNTPQHLFCLVGDPVSHSLSPFIMNRAIDACGLDGAYVPMRVPIGQLPGAVAAIRAKKMSGVNITYPHKMDVLDLIDDVTAPVECIGAANVLQFEDDRLLAHNTDCVGTVRALQQLAGVDVAGKRVAIYGAGGAGRAAAYGLLDAGAAHVSFAVRNTAKRADDVARLGKQFGDERVTAIDHKSDDDMTTLIEDSDIVINATPLGMGGTDSTPLSDKAPVKAGQYFFEFVYHPRSTPFLRTAEEKGATTIEGLALLVAQAQAGFELWTGHTFALDDMFGAVTHELEQKK